jgi:DNA-binding FrmR family transcriptional regulator
MEKHDSCNCEPAEASESCHGEAWGDYRDLLPRLKRIEGQIRGIQRMVEEQRYCVDILTQISAAQAALRQVSLAILAEHTKGCVTKAIREDGGQAAVEELLAVVNKLCTP